MSRQQPQVTPWLAGIAVLIASGGAHRYASARLADISGTVALEPGTLRRLPLQIGDWTGVEVPMEERLVRATDTNDHVNRMYQRNATAGGSSADTAALFIAYGIHARDLMPHRPEVCYPGNGWNLESKDLLETELPGGQRLPFRILTFTKSGLLPKRITVANYYVIDGIFYPDVSALRSRSWSGRSEFKYAAQIQIAAEDRHVNRAADQRVHDFATDSALTIQTLLETVVDEALAQKAHTSDTSADAEFGPSGDASRP